MAEITNQDIEMLKKFMDDNEVTEVSRLIADYEKMNETLWNIYQLVDTLEADCVIYRKRGKK